jgi:DNA topoisomerase-1
MCNHVKNVSKNFKESVDKLTQQINELKKKKKQYQEKKQNDKADKVSKKIKELKAKRELKMEMKSISLDTAKQNYIDPRITISFLKKFNIDLDKVFTKKLQERFKWATEVDESFRF